MALSVASAGGALSGAGGMGIQPFQQQTQQNFTPPMGETARAPSSNNGGGNTLHLGPRQKAISKANDKTCLAFEMDGSQICATYCDEAGDRPKVLNHSDGDRMFAAVGVSANAAGILTQWVDKRAPEERSLGLPVGVVVGTQGKTSDQILVGFNKLLGAGLDDEGVGAYGKRHRLDLKSRKLHEQRARLGILGYDSDDGVDEIDGGEKVYSGSKLCMQIKAMTREGTMHVLPEEALALCLVEMKQRVALKLFKSKEKDAYYEARKMSMIVPCCWGDSQRTAAVTAAGMIDADMTLVSSGLGSVVGALTESGLACYPLLSKSQTGSKSCPNIAEYIKKYLVPITKMENQSTEKDEEDENDDHEEEEDDDDDDDTEVEEGLVFVITACHDYMEASLVRVTGSNKSSDKKVGWVNSLEVVCARGANEHAGLEDVMVLAKAKGMDVSGLTRSIGNYNNGMIATSVVKNDEAKATLEECMAPSLAQLYKCIDRCLAVPKVLEMLKHVKNIHCCLLRGSYFGALGNLAINPVRELIATIRLFNSQECSLFMLSQDSAAKGASSILAAKNKLRKSCFNHELITRDSLQLGLGLVHCSATSKEKRSIWTIEETDVLFKRDISLPYECERLMDLDFISKCGGGSGILRSNVINFSVCEQRVPNEDIPEEYEYHRIHPVGDPLSRVNPNTFEKERGVSVLLKCSVDESGLMSLRKQAFLSEKEDDLIKHNKKPFLLRYLSRIIMALVVILSIVGFGYSSYQQYSETNKIEFGRHSARYEALENFYNEVNPEKVSSIEKALEEHKGRESVLWKKLEKKYGKAPARPDYLKFRREL